MTREKEIMNTKKLEREIEGERDRKEKVSKEEKRNK